MALANPVLGESIDSAGSGSETLETESSIPDNLTGVELYDWLAYEGIFDTELKNHLVHELIEEGIQHEDSDVRMATLSGIMWYTWPKSSFLKWQGGLPATERHLELVPGLRQFLFGVYEEGKRRHAEKEPSSSDFTSSQLDSVGLVERNGKMVLTEEFAWKSIPAILVQLFPGDLEVLDIIWESSETQTVDGSTEPSCGIIGLLNDGKFATPEANALRIQCLMANESVFNATKGLSIYQTEAGFEAMIEWLEIPHNDFRQYFPHVMEAIVSYGKNALPHAERLTALAKNHALLPDSGTTVERPSGFNFFPYKGGKYRVDNH